MDSLVNIGRSWLCWRSSSGLPHPATHAGKKRYASATLCSRLAWRWARRRLSWWLWTSLSPIQVNGEYLPTTEEFTYLGSIVRYDGGAGNDIGSRTNKTRNAFRMLNNVWRSQQYSIKTKLKLYQSCVVFTLLYGSECWKMTQRVISITPKILEISVGSQMERLVSARSDWNIRDHL